MNVSAVYLKHGDTGELAEASLADEVTDAHLSLWDKTWSPVMEAHRVNRTLTNRPEDHHWDWRRKADWWRPLLGYHSFGLLCRNELQGLMLAIGATPGTIWETNRLRRVPRYSTMEQA
jgi:hypothetical protein